MYLINVSVGFFIRWDAFQLQQDVFYHSWYNVCENAT